MSTGRILALDLATVTGWAFFAPDLTGYICSGSQDFSRYHGSKSRPAQHVGEPFAMFRRWLNAKILEVKPAAIAYEEVCRWQGYSAAHVFGALRGQMLSLAAVHAIPCFPYQVSVVKKFWTGKGNADKDAMVAATLLRLPHVDLTDDNEADALAVLNLHRRQHP